MKCRAENTVRAGDVVYFSDGQRGVVMPYGPIEESEAMSETIDVHVTKDRRGYAVWAQKREPTFAKMPECDDMAWDLPGAGRCWEPSNAVAIRLFGRMKNKTIKRFRLTAKEIER